MLSHPTRDKLLDLHGMAMALGEQCQTSARDAMGFEERLLVDRETTQRNDRQMAMRLKRARLRQSAVPEDIDWKQTCGLDSEQDYTVEAGTKITLPKTAAHATAETKILGLSP